MGLAGVDQARPMNSGVLQPLLAVKTLLPLGSPREFLPIPGFSFDFLEIYMTVNELSPVSNHTWSVDMLPANKWIQGSTTAGRSRETGMPNQKHRLDLIVTFDPGFLFRTSEPERNPVKILPHKREKTLSDQLPGPPIEPGAARQKLWNQSKPSGNLQNMIPGRL